MLKYCLKCKGWCRYDQFFQSYICACSIERHEYEDEEDEEEILEDELELSEEMIKELKLIIKEYDENNLDEEDKK